jgi:hypothetical protein
VKANPQVKKIELVIRWITRILSGMLVLFNGAYILLAILMITAAGEELFPKMTFSFLALSLLSIALLASWRWQTLGAFAIVAALLAYRMAERSRLGYEPKWSWFSTATVVIAMLFIVSSAIHWWIRKHSPKEPPSVEIRRA